MEFPTLGKHCQHDGCNQTDFLPLPCKCGKCFCRKHYNEHCLSGKCKVAPAPREVNFHKDNTIIRCSYYNCNKGSLHEMLCAKCGKHYCIEHRFHPSCPEIDAETMADKIEQFEAPKRQFLEANKGLQARITENLRKAMESTTKIKTASRIHLMRIKMKALGPKTMIPSRDRVYFSIKKPQNMEIKPTTIVEDVNELKSLETLTLEPDLKDTIPVFISYHWTLGRAIDCICETCNIKNENNIMGGPKLRLFRQLDGYCICPIKMDEFIGDLLKEQVLMEGDKLLVEYIDENVFKELGDNTHLFLQ